VQSHKVFAEKMGGGGKKGGRPSLKSIRRIKTNEVVSRDRGKKGAGGKKKKGAYHPERGARKVSHLHVPAGGIILGVIKEEGERGRSRIIDCILP